MRFSSRTICIGWLAVTILVAGAVSAGEKSKEGEKAPQDPEVQAGLEGMEEMDPEDRALMQAYMEAGTPGEEHAELAESTGTYEATVKSYLEGPEPTVSKGTSTREMILDGRVLHETFEGNFMGRPFVGHSMVGYDKAREKYWSTWVDTMSTTIMISWGEWDEEKQAVVFEGSYTDPMTGEPAPVKTILRYPEPGVETLEMWEAHGEDGEMVKTMEMTSVKQ